jgi:2-oxoglutarate dehydrogenase E2 component (dihydrolipoamide succinyltransferase)
VLIEVKVPQLSESVAEATLLNWHKQAGQYVNRDENLVDIETDKVVLETPAPDSGVLVKIVKGDGGTVTSNEVIAQIDTAVEKPASGASAVKPAASPPSPSTGEGRAGGERPQAKPEPASKPPASAAAQTAAPVMPAAQKLAAEKQVDTGSISGTGRGGRVTKGDVLQVLQGGAQPAAAPAPAAQPPNEQGKPRFPPLPPSSTPSESSKPAVARTPAPPVDLGELGSRPEQRVPMSRLRARIAERLVQSQSTAAILTTFNEVNMQPVIELRDRYKDRFEKEHGVKLGFMSFFVKASVYALKKFPVVNASIDGNDIIYHGYYDLGIAVGSPRGLVVPIVRNADQMSVAEIEKTIADFGKRAQEGKLTLEELTGGTFSISNGGVFGSMLSTPIINPPQSAILGIHATKERPVVENGQIVVRPMNYLALSYDHRIVDGREAVLSLVAIKEALEDPARMLLDV